jgi:molybdopterin-guanine dinucleotide biosynthesis protein MobB
MSMRVIGLAGWSGSGKTTLITKVIPVLVGRGLKVATVSTHITNSISIVRARIPAAS